MCGICGFLQPVGVLPQDSMHLVLDNMCASIAHRGNDDKGKYIDHCQGLGLGHQRLSIIDLKGGHQPLCDSNELAYIVFNGEIYNYIELRQELLSIGCAFKTDSDTEVILQAYLQWGDGCVNKLRGMFSFAIWDRARQRLFCARDRIGIKPFYYYWDGKSLIFASEIKALIKHPHVKTEQDLDSLDSFLRFQYIPAPNTIYKNIYKLSPAHTLILENEKIITSKFWDIYASTEIPLTNKSLVLEELRNTLEDSVSLHMQSEVPLGAFLSGGIDSTAIVALMSQYSNTPIKTQTASFANIDFDESRHARSVAEYYKTSHQESLVEMTLVDDLDKIIYHLDEPFADASAIPTYYLSREARKRVTVSLSGDGGDELFTGYDWYSELSRLQFINRYAPKLLASGISKYIGPLLPVSLRGASLIRNLGFNSQQQHLNLVSCFSNIELEKLCQFSSDLKSRLPDKIIENLYQKGASQLDAVSAAQLVDLQSYLVEDILMKVDKMSMAHGLEIRVPLLDHKVVELSMRIPIDFKLKGNQRKIILKESMQDIIPRQFMERQKQGFNAPIAEWLKGELREKFEDTVLSSQTTNSAVFNNKEVVKLWKKFNKSVFHVGLPERLWTLFCYELWHQAVH